MTFAPYSYQSEKMCAARRCLMAPHYEGEDQSFATSMACCETAFRDLDEATIEDQSILDHVRKIKQIMESKSGTYLQRATQMTREERSQFSQSVDELASMFQIAFWSHPDA
jgi:hypothetical protein